MVEVASTDVMSTKIRNLPRVFPILELRFPLLKLVEIFAKVGKHALLHIVLRFVMNIHPTFVPFIMADGPLLRQW